MPSVMDISSVPRRNLVKYIADYTGNPIAFIDDFPDTDLCILGLNCLINQQGSKGVSG